MSAPVETTLAKPFLLSYQKIGLGVAAAIAAVLGYFRFSGTATPEVAGAVEQDKKLVLNDTKYFTADHPMYAHMQEISSRIFKTDHWQLQEFAKAVKMVDAFESMLATCMAKPHRETMRYPEYAFNIRRDFNETLKNIAKAQRQDDTNVRANIVLEFADKVTCWMTDGIGNLNAMNDEKVAASIIGS